MARSRVVYNFGVVCQCNRLLDIVVRFDRVSSHTLSVKPAVDQLNGDIRTLRIRSERIKIFFSKFSHWAYCARYPETPNLLSLLGRYH